MTDLGAVCIAINVLVGCFWISNSIRVLAKVIAEKNENEKEKP